MASMLVFIALINFCILASAAKNVGNNYESNVVKFEQKDDESWGRLYTCAPISSDALSFRWTPLALKPNAKGRIEGEIKFVEDFSQGSLCIIMKKDGDKMFDQCQDVKCEDVSVMASTFFNDFKCPIAKGYTMKKSMPITLPSNLYVQPGKYWIQAILKNHLGKFVQCIQGNVEVDE